MSMAPSNIATGAEVYTLDGEKLGKVKTVRSDYFKVDAPMKPDYWLRCDCVNGGAGYAGDPITVAFSKDRLDEFKYDLEDDNV